MEFEGLKDLAHHALKVAAKDRADYVEARVQAESGIGLLLKNGEPQPAMIADGLGIGVRVLHRGAMAFGSTNSMNRRAVAKLVSKTTRMAKASASLAIAKVSFDDSRPAKGRILAPEKERVEGADVEWLRSSLAVLDGLVKSGPKISNRMLSLSVGCDEKYFVNTDGAEVQSRVPSASFFAVITATEGGQTAQRMIQQAQTGGLEAVKLLGLDGKLREETRVLGEVLGASKPPTGVLDVILGPELSGIAAHESVGHPQEADRILGREGAQAGESYLKRDSLGMKVGSEEANISDDPTILRSNGYCPIDDEGVLGRKRRLIVDGKVNEFLQNRSTAKELDERNNGSARASSYDKEPIIRMSNTFVEPGDKSLDELVKMVKEGVYIKSFTEWNIDDKRLNQRYVGLEAYHIKNGELREMVKGPVLEITTPALWGSVKGRSKTLEFESATCGKGDPMQGIPVSTGGPDTLLSGIRLGAR